MKEAPQLLQKASSLPRSPGCYLFFNPRREVIYVGKAKNLRARVSSYFQSSLKSLKTKALVSHIESFEFIVTQSETEAFVLESNLIKKHSPKYNVQLKDDKSYPYIVVDKGHDYPRLQYKRRAQRGPGKLIFGPFTHGSGLDAIMRMATKSFLLRDCTDREFQSRTRPCLLHQMHQCSAPCVLPETKAQYARRLDLAVSIFQGRPQRALDALQAQMRAASQKEEFEKAAQIRDHIEALEEFVQKFRQQNAEVNFQESHVDVWGMHLGPEEVDLAVFIVRNNLLLGQKHFHFLRGDMDDPSPSSLWPFLLQYYARSTDTLPRTMAWDFGPPEAKQAQDAFSQALDTPIKISPITERFSSLHNLALKQARECQNMRQGDQGSVYVALNQLKGLLGLEERPIVLECFDVAVWQGSSPTASQVVFHNGRPERSKYRFYHLDPLPEGNNDFHMLQQVLKRRLKHGDIPDILALDGGGPQLRAAEKILSELGLSIPLLGVAKPGPHNKEERLVIPGRANPYLLSKSRPLLKLMISLRDEAHRYCRRLHHSSEKHRALGSELDGVEGIGPQTKKRILRRLQGPLDHYRGHSPEELAHLFGLSRKVAHGLKERINLKHGSSCDSPQSIPDSESFLEHKDENS